MQTPSPREVTQWLQAWSEGDQRALEQLTSLVYKELRRLAHRHIGRERPGHPLKTTALINEIYLRLVVVQKVSWHDRAHFFAVCARMMRRTLIDFARSRLFQKRTGNAIHASLDNTLGIARQPAVDLVALDDALNARTQLDPRKSRVVELCFFGGLSVEETVEVLKVSPETVMRDWKFARTWLRRELYSPRPHEA